MMKQWMELFASPLDEDISHVVHFMRSHILDQNLEMAFNFSEPLRGWFPPVIARTGGMLTSQSKRGYRLLSAISTEVP
ncbi:hypothetical protein BSL78_22800 [Apostichopus japonicus]|uniref:Uncharacterized protein n=1 Tax=Stichopus japonicus TaxID=307972 RepID=A0A2G8JXA9_STIJA|nr:hypothetical protein BSL78_22800 [Apostichopus japonicus]